MSTKQIITSLLIGFLGLSVVTGQNDPTAVSVLKKSEAIYRTFKNIDAQFELTLEIPDYQNEVQTGRLMIMDDMFRVETENQDIICDNTTIWTHLKLVNEVQINYFEPDDDMIQPSQLFTVYKQDYTSYYVGESNKDDRRIHTIDLVPNDKDQSFFKIKLEIDTKSYLFRSIKVLSKDGTNYMYNITSFTPNQNIKTTDFQFSADKYPGIDIIDLR